MKKSHKNTVFTYMLNAPLGFDNFEIESDLWYIYITYKPNPEFKFVIEQDDDNFDFFRCSLTRFAPGFPFELVDSSYSHISNSLRELNKWMEGDLSSYIAEEETIDLLEEYKKGIKLTGISDIDFVDDSKFSTDQREQIRLGFEELKFLIANNYANNDRQIALINGRLDYLVDATERLNKTDWKGIFITTVIGIITTLTLDTQKGNDLFNAFLNILHVMPTLFHNSNSSPTP